MIQHGSAEALRTYVLVPAVMMASSVTSSSFVLPGPEMLVVFGVNLPIFSAIGGALGVLLGQVIAPAPVAVIGKLRRGAVIAALLGIVETSAIATGQMPLVVFSWGIGLGFSGNTIVETLGAEAVSGVRSVASAFFSTVATKLGGGPKTKDIDHG